MKNHDLKPEESSKSSDALRADVEQTRERLSADVEALGTKLSPENMKSEAKRAIKRTVQRGTDEVRESVSSAGASVMSLARDNPIPLALIGVGVGWLVYNARNGSRGRNGAAWVDYGARGRSEVYDDSAYDYDSASSVSLRDKAGQQLDRVRGKMREGVESVRRAASDTAHQARDKVEQLEHAAQDRAVQARELAEHTLDDNPLLLGAIALGTGIAVGLAIPATQSENQLVGEYRDRLFSKARERAQGLRGVAEHAAERAVETAKSEVSTL